MKTDKHNDWTDAFRESFPEEARPAAGGWEAVAGRMRRAAARRRAALAAAALALPLTAGLIFLPSGHESRSPEVAVAEAPVLPDAAPLVPDATTLAPDTAPLVPEATTVVPDHLPVIPSGAKEPAPSLLVADIAGLNETDPFVGLRPPQDDKDSEAKDSPAPAPTNTNTVTAAPDAAVPGLDEYPGYTSPRHHTVSVGVHAGSTAAGATTSLTTSSMAGAISTKSANNHSFNNTSGTILQHQYVHDLPVSLGLTARYGLTDRLWLESGIEYTRMHSRLDGLHTVMHYAGIPLRVDCRLFSTSRFEVYAGLGGKAEKCLKATLGGVKVSEPKLQWSGSALLGAQARLSGSAWIYVQPDLTYYFTKSTLVSYRSENRLGLTVNAGLRFDISR